jgi:hypothetical protein
LHEYNAAHYPKAGCNPPFNMTRASHCVRTAKDLSYSRSFYVDLIGFIVSDEDADTLYLRGVAEACHVSDASGAPIELCAQAYAKVRPEQLGEVHRHRNAVNGKRRECTSIVFWRGR